jgi:hypothetical protein
MVCFLAADFQIFRFDSFSGLIFVCSEGGSLWYAFWQASLMFLNPRMKLVQLIQRR